LTARLQSLLHAQDDWSRLLACSALLTLGEGTPDLCRERNALIAKGFERGADFTFPKALRDETQKEEFRRRLSELLTLIFLQAPDQPSLRPEYFDPANTTSRYFLSSPREFFAIAADVLDPKGETDLSKWRKP
jgi:hypothetical protein